MKKYFFVYVNLLLVLISIFTWAACSKSTNNLPSIEILNHSMTVQNFTGDKPSSIAVISGSAKNISNSILKHAVILATFYDAKGNVVDKASSTVNNINPGAVWNFSIQSSGTEAWKIVKYSLEVK